MLQMTSPLEPTSDPVNPYASPLAEEAVAGERTRWRIVAVVVASVCSAVVGIGVLWLASTFGWGRKFLGPQAGLGPAYSVQIAISIAFAFAAFLLSMARSRRAWDQYEGLLERKRQMLEDARERREAKNAPPASPFADRAR